MYLKKIENNTTPYKVNSNGAIEIKSIKNTQILNFLDKYDNAGVDDDLLQGVELINCLNDIEQDKKMQKLLNIHQDQGKYVYYEQKDKNGKLVERSVCMKESGDMITFRYLNGKPMECICIDKNGEKDVINLNTGESKNYLPNSTEVRKFTLYQKACKKLKQVALY